MQALDFFPTFMEIATGKKYKNKELDGESIMPLLKGKKMKERNLYFSVHIIQTSMLLLSTVIGN